MSGWGDIVKGIPASEFDFNTFTRKGSSVQKTTGVVTTRGGGVTVKFDFSQFNDELAEFINDNCEKIAKQVAKDARESIHSVTKNLRKGIRARESKFDDGGWIVMSRAPHSFLVEYGGIRPRSPKDKKVMKGKDGTFYGKEVAPMPAKPFLRPALEKNIALAKREFGTR